MLDVTVLAVLLPLICLWRDTFPGELTPDTIRLSDGEIKDDRSMKVDINLGDKIETKNKKKWNRNESESRLGQDFQVGESSLSQQVE